MTFPPFSTSNCTVSEGRAFDLRPLLSLMAGPAPHQSGERTYAELTHTHIYTNERARSQSLSGARRGKSSLRSLPEERRGRIRQEDPTRPTA